MVCNSNVNKTVYFFYSLKHREIVTVKSLKSIKKKQALILFYMLVEKHGWAIEKNLFA